ncbi:MAG: DUF4136 domain-containing protein [Gemmatimonadota bacterium]|nr:DUF4136 domain-containing protein [Gemmatimonadota bacterium]
MSTNPRFRTALGFVIALAVTACSGLSVVSDYDPSGDFGSYQTYSWLPDAESEGSGIAQDPLVDGRIRAAIDNDLTAKGFQKVDDGGDFAVGYQISTREEVSYTTMYSGWGGYGYGYGYWGPSVGMSSSSTTQHTSTIGQLLIGVFDQGSKELVWRSTGEKTISDRQRSPEEAQENINNIISRVMESFPPGGSGS